MKNKKKAIIIIIVSFIVVTCLEIFSTGHTHVVVVKDNENLTTKNRALTSENKGLKTSVASLEVKNEELVVEKAEMQEMVSQVIGDLDSTKGIVQKIKRELTNEKVANIRMSSGDEFDFQPIKLPTEDGN